MIWNAFLLALREIRRSAMRSILTTLGIVIGVASVIAMVMLGDATTAYVTNSISKLGTNMLVVIPGQERRGPPSSDLTAKRFTHNDVEALKHEIDRIRGAAPVGSISMHAVYGNQNYSTTVEGSDNDYFTIKDWVFASGRPFSDAELQGGKAVCVIGETVRRELFGNASPLGARIRIGGEPPRPGCTCRYDPPAWYRPIWKRRPYRAGMKNPPTPGRRICPPWVWPPR